MMRFVVAAVSIASLIEAGRCQAPAPPVQPTPPVQNDIRDQIRIDEFQLRKRDDDYGIASFVIANNTEKPVHSLELNCWINDDRARGSTVLVWPKGQIPPHKAEKFTNVNIGLGGNSRAECEVSAAE
jgi:hypothetical protein